MVVYHMVIFKYKPGTTPDQIAKFVKGAETLRTIPGTLAVRAGATRPFSKTSFTPTIYDVEF